MTKSRGSSRSRPRTAFDELTADYVDESHIQSFAEALHADELAQENLEVQSPQATHPSTPAPHSPRVRKVSALSDFAPVNLKVKKRRRRDLSHHHKRQDWLFILLRWPLLLFIFLFIWCEFGFYVLIRQMVNTKEWLSAWRGKKGVLRKRLRAATTYQEWKDAAETLDEYLQFHEWKRIDEDPFYDWKLVRKVRRSLKNLRERKDVRGVLGVLETCIRTNFAGVESSRLYSETFLGTKDLIEAYFDEQVKALEYIRESKDLSVEEKKRFFKTANTNLGTSALCLSGGASFGYYHTGVVKAFLDADLLPRVITGTSAGGLIAALVCTRTNAELKQILTPNLANRITACEEPFRIWFRRFWKTGARFDSLQWARKATFFTRGSLTFKEAYVRTGRILNISVIPADRHSPTKLLNYMTAPDCVIWSALLASAAVPGILNPVVLMQKSSDGRIVPWNWGSRFKDGSLRVDIPIQALNLYFNVTHPVVSQVNPHVHLFFFAPRGSPGKPVAHRKGKGWRGNFLLSAAEQWLKLELTKNFKVIRDLELLPQLLGQDWSSVFLQRFDGTITIWPRTRVLDWLHILSDPDPPELERMIRVGQIVTWPKLHMISNRHRIEQQIFLGRQVIRKSLHDRGQATTPGSPIPPQPNGGRAEPIPESRTLVPPSTSSGQGVDFPLSVDTDAEDAFANGSRWFFKRGHLPVSPSPSDSNPPTDKGPRRADPLRLPIIRRKWAANLVDHGGQREEVSTQAHTADPTRQQQLQQQQQREQQQRSMRPQSHQRSDSFFARLRTQSFPAIPVPFGSLHKTTGKELGKEVNDRAGETWSSDSSSDNDLSESRHIRFPSATNFREDWDPTYPDEDIDGADY